MRSSGGTVLPILEGGTDWSALVSGEQCPLRRKPGACVIHSSHISDSPMAGRPQSLGQGSLECPRNPSNYFSVQPEEARFVLWVLVFMSVKRGK